jgi:polysaccharide biosynthesis protein PelA
MPIRYLLSLLLTLAPGLVAAQPATRTASAAPTLASVAFFYGSNVPWHELKAFDLAVIEADHLPPGPLPELGGTRLAAYVALGEVQPSRNYAARIPPEWLRGENSAWGSRLIDQSQPRWPAFVAEQVIAPLWQRGLRTFFLDTLDSYHLHARTDTERAQQEAGMVAVIGELVRRYPGIRFVFNRGFEILPKTHAWVDAVAAESLFRRYQPENKRYGEVPPADRSWLLDRLGEVRNRYHLPVIAIDYVPAGERALARETARRIMDLGITPWVATPELDTLGLSSVEVMPRRVLVVHSPVASEYAQREIGPVLFGSMPLQYLGYVPEFVDVRQLPAFPLAGRYAGVVLWLNRTPESTEARTLLTWLQRQVSDALPLVLLDEFEFLLNTPLARTLGLDSEGVPRSLVPVEIEQQHEMVGYETRPRPGVDGFFPLVPANATPLLTLRRGSQRQVAAALTSWGAYVLDPIVVLPGDSTGNRWVINPFELFRHGLQQASMPVPDVSTESGRRMLLIHMDGDGWVSRSEMPGNKLAGEVLLERVVRRYPVPMTISIIEAEISPEGLFPKLSPLAEQAAREVFRAPHVAMASHSYSHPFFWGQLARGETGQKPQNLRLPGYAFSLEREIQGSVRYIESRLAPPGKKVQMFLWTGDCIPGSDAVAMTYQAGLLNMNGGDTTATRSQPTLTRVEGLGLARGAHYQVFAPNQNENVYTNEWTGPYYGFDRVIETFEFTEKPRRLKPINLYFHTYLLTKRAGLQSFERILQYALGQEIAPVHAADYARKVLDFQNYVIARTPEGWRIRGGGALRTLRVPETLGTPDLARSRAVAGYRDGAEGRYLHLAGGAAELVFDKRAPVVPHLHSANARVSAYAATPSRQRWTFEGEVPLEFTLANAEGCRVRIADRELQALRRDGRHSHYALPQHAAGPIEAICQR